MIEFYIDFWNNLETTPEAAGMGILEA